METQELEKSSARASSGQLSRVLIFFAVQAVLLFSISGRLWWLAGWIYFGFNLMGGVGATIVLARCHPSLMEERTAAYKAEKGTDKVLVQMLAVWGPLLLCIVAGLDARFRWFPVPPLALRIAAFTIGVVGIAATLWAMQANRFFSSVVRLQTERGHNVVSDGPYHFVRHPGYLGMVLIQVAYPLILGTPAVFAVTAWLLAVVIIRTSREDGFLKDNLTGYRDYASRVRYRLIPGIW